MANPNIVGVTGIYSNNNFLQLRNTVANTIINNPATSGKLFKITNLTVSNANTANSVTATVKFHNADDGGGTGFNLIKAAAIPVGGSLVVFDKNTTKNVLEDQSITVTAGSGGSAGGLDVVADWDEIA